MDLPVFFRKLLFLVDVSFPICLFSSSNFPLLMQLPCRTRALIYTFSYSKFLLLIQRMIRVSRVVTPLVAMDVGDVGRGRREGETWGRGGREGRGDVRDLRDLRDVGRGGPQRGRGNTGGFRKGCPPKRIVAAVVLRCVTQYFSYVGVPQPNLATPRGRTASYNGDQSGLPKHHMRCSCCCPHIAVRFFVFIPWPQAVLEWTTVAMVSLFTRTQPSPTWSREKQQLREPTGTPTFQNCEVNHDAPKTRTEWNQKAGTVPRHKANPAAKQ